MKKLLALLLALVMIMSLAACGNNSDDDEDDDEKKGVVTERRVHESVLRDIVLDFIPTTGWAAAGLDFSPIRGPEGNIEFLLHLLPEENVTVKINESTILDIISSAYDKILKSGR